MYRLVKEDSKGDKAWNHYAGAVEMIALSLFMLGRTGEPAIVKEIRERMETASKYYKIGKAMRAKQVLLCYILFILQSLHKKHNQMVMYIEVNQ